MVDKPFSVLTRKERELIEKLGECWNDFLQLPEQHTMDKTEFCHGIHRLQDKVGARPAIRELNSLNEKPTPKLCKNYEPSDKDSLCKHCGCNKSSHDW